MIVRYATITVWLWLDKLIFICDTLAIVKRVTMELKKAVLRYENLSVLVSTKTKMDLAIGAGIKDLWSLSIEEL